MGLLTIGAFARASRLSPKALRLYDRLGLLTPARVDPATGYRLYAPEQLEHARLVAWLRQLGMPLARIKRVRELDAPTAAREVGDFWERVEADTAARRDLATFLVEHLSGRNPTMPITPTTPTTPTTPAHPSPLEIRYAALSDTGLVRESNQDTAYAGGRLLAVADGFGPGGGHAGAAAVEVLRGLDSDENSDENFGDNCDGNSDGTTVCALAPGIPAGDLLNALEDAVERADRAVRGVASSGSLAEGSDGAAEDSGEAADGSGGAADGSGGAGTTLTAMLWTGSQLALVHVGDSRAYLLREGALFQITHDHTRVQALVDEGRLTPEEAASHPQRALLVRALAGGADVTADTRLQDAAPGDRYLLCSDGLSAVVPTGTVRQVLTSAADPEGAVRELVALANAEGGPDNVSCVVADVVEAAK